MKYNPFVVRKQSGKQTVTAAAGPVGNSNSSAVITLKDTIYYQVGKANDYVQETN